MRWQMRLLVHGLCWLARHQGWAIDVNTTTSGDVDYMLIGPERRIQWIADVIDGKDEMLAARLKVTR